MNKIQYFDVKVMTNDKRTIKGFELENKIKIILISDPDINTSSCSVAVGAGYLQDEFEGTAHFLEHLLFMGSEKYPEQNDYHSYIQINGGSDNAFTADNMTCYYLSLETTFLKKGIEMLSWFFRAPLLDEKHIDSEMEIIDSEHNKNILIDNWIMDDIFKNFIKNNNKYKKFGTGNLKSLKNITKKDIIDFYDKYYTTDNLYVCIVDSKDISIMISEYINYFQEIPIKLYLDHDERFHHDNIELIKNNIIIFNSSSEYIFVNFYIIIDISETNIIEYQLAFFINYLIGSEYTGSIAYFLKENEFIKNMSSTLDYFYDLQANINLQLVMIDNNINNFLQCYYSLNKFIDNIKKLTENDFIELYNNYQKIKMLKLLFDSTNDSVSISNNIVENIIKGNISDAVIRQNYVPEYNSLIYDKFINIIKSLVIKITTNINYYNRPNSSYINSIWYESSYYIDNIDSNIINLNQNNKYIDWKFEPLNIIGIKNFIIKNNLINSDIDKSKFPELIYNNDKKKIYLLEINKYNKPIANITIIRKNINLLNKENKLIIGIYIGLCDKILNYFLETMIDYKLNFNITLSKEFLIYNFYGIDYAIGYFISKIISKIDPETIFYNNNIKKYFNEIIRDIQESITNLKYNSPYIICSKYLSYLLDDNFLPEDKLEYISKLSFEFFENKINQCLKYSHEYYILIGIKKYGVNFNFNKNNEYIFNDDNYMVDLINMISLNPKKFFVVENTFESNNINKTNFINYTLDPDSINSNEINNCIIRYWNIKKLSVINNTDLLDIDISKKIIKFKLISSIVSEIFNEPLFDKVRTIDKLGYIVKCDYKILINNNNIYYLVLFLIQSSYSIKKISNSIGEFNEYFKNDFETNYDNYLEKFRLLKESKLIEFNKPISDLYDEISVYIESIITKNFNFDLNKLYYDVCETIDFISDVEPIINNIIKNNSKHYEIILEKNKKN